MVYQNLPISSSSVLLPVLLFIGAIVIISLIIRELITWYWKINKICNLLEKIEQNTNPHKEAIENIQKPEEKIEINTAEDNASLKTDDVGPEDKVIFSLLLSLLGIYIILLIISVIIINLLNISDRLKISFAILTALLLFYLCFVAPSFKNFMIGIFNDQK